MDTSGIEAFAAGFVRKFGASLVDALDDSGTIMKNAIQDNVQTRLQKGRHTGSLLASWKVGAVYYTDSDEAALDVFSGLPYALIHDRGGVIRPTRAKALAIPNDDNTWFFKSFNKELPSPSELRRTNPAWAKQLWFDKKTMTLKDVKGQVAYFLRRSVRMPPKYYIGDAVKDSLPEIHEIFDNLVKQAIEEGAE